MIRRTPAECRPRLAWQQVPALIPVGLASGGWMLGFLADGCWSPPLLPWSESAVVLA